MQVVLLFLLLGHFEGSTYSFIRWRLYTQRAKREDWELGINFSRYTQLFLLSV